MLHLTAMLLFLHCRSSTSFHHTFKPRGTFFHATSHRLLNRFLFDPSELEEDETTVILPKDDFRTVHAAKVLGLQNGDTIRAGVVSKELLTDSATIQWLPEGKVKKAEPLGDGSPPGSLKISMLNLEEPPAQMDLKVSLLLALPRPLQLGRMLPMISQMGVDQLILTGAKKVPKDYFGSHLFRKPELITEKLVEGLCQAGDVRLPNLWIRKNVRDFLAQELDVLFPKDEFARVIAHPQRASDTSPAKRMKDVVFPKLGDKRLLLAVGPEGGWEEPGELDKFHELGFQQVTLGTRVLRSDVAVVSLLSLGNEACQE
jgi:16S rRNA (uracil1498-N3)-methyltransferase